MDEVIADIASWFMLGFIGAALIVGWYGVLDKSPGKALSAWGNIFLIGLAIKTVGLLAGVLLFAIGAAIIKRNRPKQTSERKPDSTAQPAAPAPPQPQIIPYQCPHCSTTLQIPAHFAGFAGTCNHCENKITVPLNREPAQWMK